MGQNSGKKMLHRDLFERKYILVILRTYYNKKLLFLYNIINLIHSKSKGFSMWLVFIHNNFRHKIKQIKNIL
jgi:hypothetical protein